MTDLFSLLFIAMIPIDFKITKFSLHLFVYFFCNNYNIWWAHKHHKRHFKQKNDYRYAITTVCIQVNQLPFVTPAVYDEEVI